MKDFGVASEYDCAMLLADAGAVSAPDMVSPTLKAASACEVVLSTDVEPAWDEGVRVLRAWLRRTRDVDCSRVELRRERSGVRVAFTTIDGRRAERFVPSPRDLFPIVEALATTIPESTSAAEAAGAAESAPSPIANARARLREPDANGDAPPGGAPPLGLVVDARGGVRLPGPVPCSSSGAATCTFAHLLIGLDVGVDLGRWELGVAAAFEPAYATLRGVAPVGLSITSYSASLSAGRYVPLGAVDLILGAAAGLLWTNELDESDNEPRGMSDPDTFAQVEPRAGIFVGALVPQTGGMRFRPQFAFDVTPSHLGHAWTSPDAPVPGLAWWTASASIGVQWRGL
jgi:hypothetical protein